MAEKRRATTFRTSRGAIVYVDYPDIYIAPSIAPVDVTSPVEMRHALSEELRKRPQPIFAEYQGNPIIGLGASGSYREYGCARPLVTLNPEDYTYYMLVRAESPVSGEFRVGLFTSPDGLEWTEHPRSPVLDLGAVGAWDARSIMPESLAWDGTNNRWNLYYIGRDAANVWRGGVAHSADLVNWTRNPINPIMGTRAVNNAIPPGLGEGFGVVELWGILPRPRWIAVVNDGSRGQHGVELNGSAVALEIYTSNDGVNWVWQREQLIWPDTVTPVWARQVYPHVPEVFALQKFYGLFVILYEAWSHAYAGQYYVAALASYDCMHWWQVPKPLYHETGYEKRSPLHHTLHPYILLARDGAFLYHMHGHLVEGGTRWKFYIDVAFIDPQWLLETLTAQSAYVVWDDETVVANTNGYMYANALGTRRVTGYFEASVAGILTVEVSPDGSGNWTQIYQSAAVETQADFETTRGFTHLRARHGVDADLTLKVVLER